MKKASSSNTKAEILEVYENVLSQLEAQRKENAQLQSKLQQNEKLVKKVVQESKKGATHSIQEIRVSLNQELDKIEEGIQLEQQKFKELREAIEIEKALLEDLYKIKVQAESLDALIETTSKQKQSFEERAGLEENQLEEKMGAQKRKWEREKEEYLYELQQNRKKEQDIYLQKKDKQERELEDKKSSFEKEIDEKERIFNSAQEELKSSKKEIEQLNAQLEAVVKTTKKEVSETLTKEFEFKRQIESKDMEADLKLKAQMVETLELKVAEQNKTIQNLNQKSELAGSQVKDIAIKAIENSGLKTVPIIREDTKNPTE